jgi:mono/diheme cytochrome c family protein
VASTRAASQDTPAPLSRFAERKAETLLRQSLPCLGCHRLNGEGGLIGPDLTTVATRRDAVYIAAMVTDPQRTLPGTPMPRTAMSEATRALVISYLTSRTAGPTSPGAGVSSPARAPLPARDAPALYATYCAACHGARGGGDGPNAEYLPVKPAVHASRTAMSKRSDDALFDTIFGGGAIMNRSPRMPAFGETLTRDDIRSLVRYIRTLCGCRGPAWGVAAGDRR